MIKKIYHGSNLEIKKPTYGIGNINNDYGLGFYCCSSKTLADEWAARKPDSFGVVNEYYIKEDGLKILDLTKPPYDNVLNWIAILMHFRKLPAKLIGQCSRELKYLEDNYYINVNDYDVVIGYRADDNYFQFPQALLRSEVLIESIQEIFKLGKLGKQYVLISEKAFSKIVFVDSFESKYDYKKYHDRKEKADKEYLSILERDRYKNGMRMIDLVRDK